MTIQEIKKEFYAYRNGELAGTLRNAGWPHSVIFGLNVPQLAAIAARQERSRELALQLWADRNVRESRLLAPYIFPLDMTSDDIEEIGNDVLTREEADMLAFRWLRYLPDASLLMKKWQQSNIPITQYLSKALARFVE